MKNSSCTRSDRKQVLQKTDLTGNSKISSAPKDVCAFLGHPLCGILPNVMVVLSGMSSMEQMQDNLSFMEDFRPLNEEERLLCFRAAEIINSKIAIPCTACSYCTDGCPMNIPIPQFFSIYNEDMREHLEEKRWTINFTNNGIIAKNRGKASECIGCGQCESVCPQHLTIIDYLKDVAKHYER